jgi:hypothetical protein
MRNPADVLKETLPAFIQRLKAMEGFCLPRQQFVHMGQLAYDCELIAVHSDRVYQGRPGQEQPGLQVQTGGIAMYAMGMTEMRLPKRFGRQRLITLWQGFVTIFTTVELHGLALSGA